MGKAHCDPTSFVLHVRTGHGKTDWFQIGKGIHQGCILSSCLFNLYAEYISSFLDGEMYVLWAVAEREGTR